MKSMRKTTVSSFIALLLLLSAVQGKIVVVNSQDWGDVYSGLLYARLNNLPAYFLSSSNPQGILRILPGPQEVILIQSSNPFVSNLNTLLTSKGYTVTLRTISDGSVDLLPSGINTYYVVEKDRPSAAIAVAPLAVANKAWVFLVDQRNLPTVTSLLRGKNVILVGYFTRSVKTTLDDYKSSEIIDPNKFTLSIKVAEEFLKIKPTTQVIISEGRYIENELFAGHSPVLLVGTNLLPQETLRWMQSKRIKTCVVLGAHLTYIGEQIRSLSKRAIGVFIKYGEAVPGSPIYALNMMPIPTSNLKLSVISVIYDPTAKKIMITYKNDGEIGLFELTTFRVLHDGTEIASGGDENVKFIGAGETTVSHYNIDIPADLLSKNLTVEIFASYGDSPNNLDSYLTNKGKFGPPLTLPLLVKSVSDRSQLDIISLTYYKPHKRIGVKVGNIGTVGTWFMVKIPSIKIHGVESALQSDVRFVPAGESKEVYMGADLDEFDLVDDSSLVVVVDFGEKRDLLVKSVEKRMKMNVVSTPPILGFFLSTTGMTVIGIMITVMIIIVLIWLSKGRKKIKFHKRY